MKRAFPLAVAATLMVSAAYAQRETTKASDKATSTKRPAKAIAATRTDTSQQPLTADETISHVLNRFGFGPRPGDLQRVRGIGWKAWIEAQLAPDTVPDMLVDQKLAEFAFGRLDAAEYAKRENAVRRGVAIANRRNVLRQQAAATGNRDSMMEMGSKPGTEAVVVAFSDSERQQLEESQKARRELVEASRQFVTEKFVRAVESERQLREVLVDFWSNHFNIDISKTRSVKIADEHSVVRAHAMGRFSDLLKASARSPAMLVYLDNFQSVADAPTVSEVSNPGALPSNWDAFRRLVRRGLPMASQLATRLEEIAVQTSTPVDVVYERFVRATQPGNRDKRGLNENYARELLELHTLGVDGGYTQKDVQEVARCLTGWTIAGGRYGGEYVFNARSHDRGEKNVLGTRIPAGGGMEDGEMVLDMLAKHPSTMRHISRKLCIRFVSDNPPDSLVERCVETWKRTDGDIREIVRTIALSKEFHARSAYRCKVKSPFEYAVSSVRALGGAIAERSGSGLGVRPSTTAGNPSTLEGQVSLMGQPIFRYAFPTGWPEDSSKWVSSGALISRINFALALTSGKINDVVLAGAATDLGRGKTNAEWLESVALNLLASPVGRPTRDVVLRQMELDPHSQADPLAQAPRLTALLLGSPEFQRR